MKKKKLEITFNDTFRKRTDRSRNRALRKFKEALAISQPVLENFLKKELKIKLDHQLGCNLTLCGVAKITSLNAQYRQKKRKTDVLSFPIFDFQNEVLLITPSDLGDIFICFDVAASQAKELEVSLENELLHLFIHGFLHLLGFDHERSSKDEKIMVKWEDHLIKKIHRRWEC